MSTILIVDDDLIAAKTCSDILKYIGYETSFCLSTEKAILMLKNQVEPIDLLITDIVMPSINGIMLAKKAQKIRKNIKIMFMSGYPRDYYEDIKEEFFIQKPYSIKEIKSKIEKILIQPS